MGRLLGILTTVAVLALSSCISKEPDDGGNVPPSSLSSISVYDNAGEELGGVFYVDPSDDSKGKVISSAGGLMPWASANDNWRISSYKGNYDYIHTVVTTSERYKDNPEDFPAVSYCEQMRRDYGGNWHVPSLDEMNLLFNAYYGKPYYSNLSAGLEYVDQEGVVAAQRFDSLLVSMGGDSLLEKTDKYWISDQNSNGNMQYVGMMKYLNSNDVQTSEKYVRCILDVDYAKPEGIAYPQTDIGKLLEGPLTSRVVDILWDTTYTVTPGLEYYKMKIKTDAEDVMDTYLLRMDLSKDLDIRVSVSRDTKGTTWEKETLSYMAAYLNSPSKPVYAMVNGDFCDNRTPIRPRGPVHCNGQVLCSTYSQDPDFPQQGLSYVGVTYDGKMVIGPSEEYDAVKSTLRECTGAGLILLEDSKIVGKGSVSRDPRTAIGYTSGHTVWILAVDGRHKGTEGMTYTEMSSIFFGLGCEAAVNLDGGGSTEMIARNPLTGKLEICNWPSDPTDGEGGEERPRPNAWAVVKK